jgi:FixJ family two-component response regulator
LPDEVAISIADDYESVREGLVGLMQSHGYAAQAFESGASFLGSERLGRTDCLITDMHMPGMTGLELVGRLAASGALAPTILITARHDLGVRQRALDAGVLCYLAKPFREDDLLKCIHSALKTRDRDG